METKLLEEDFEWAAKELGCEVAAIKAVATVESAGSGFLKNGKPKILFERHLFHRLTKGKFDMFPDISNKRPGGYTKDEYARLEKARQLDDPAALKSASWGMFQILGSNHKAAGFGSVEEYVIASTTGVRAHLEAFVSFIKADARLLKAIVTKNWTLFARVYNGPAYKKNAYDKKMAAEYKEFHKAAAQAKTASMLRIQVELIRRGLYTGHADGIYGPKTKEAISKFEDIVGLPVTGVVSGALVDKLFPATMIA